ncbi:MAG: DUF721 domain-containing protein [Candidatus Brocadiales bacterium]
MHQRKLKPLAEILEGIVPKLKPQGRRTRQRVWEAWREAIGKEKANHTKVILLRRGKLHVEVESSALLQELTGMNKADVTAAMREKLGGMFVDDIKLKLAKD